MWAVLLQTAIEIAGVVLGPGGKPLPGARVAVGELQVVADPKGRFALDPGQAGSVEVRITCPGMEPQVRSARPGDALLVLMEPQVGETTVEVVEGSGYSSQEGSTSTLSRMEIYTTPGAAADVLQAVKGLPGVSNASEGAELFVRGGKPEEVGIWLNGGRLARPFHHPNTQGGIFTAVDTALVTRVDFVPGAFSARYGNALSAVLDLSTEQSTPLPSRTLLLTLPTQGFAADQPVGPGLFRYSVRRSDPVLLDKWYGLAPSFEESPLSHDAQVNWQQPLGSGRFLATGLFSMDHLAVDTTIANLAGTYRNHSRTRFGALQWNGALGDWGGLLLCLSQGAASLDWNFDRWGMAQEERSRSARVEFTLPIGTAQSVEAGWDLEQGRLNPDGQVPVDLGNWGPTAAARRFAYGFLAQRRGAYLTWRTQFSPRVGLSVGGRSDGYDLPAERTRDLRTTLSILLREGITLRLAGGSFHQAPTLTQLDPHAGNPNLRIMRATHALVSLDAAWKSRLTWNWRFEAYRKDYDRLVQEDASRRYLSTGRGYAQGLDVLAKAAGNGWRAWIGYGYLGTRRREADQPALGVVPTSVPHNLTSSFSRSLGPGWELAASFRAASGSPRTPVLGGVPNPGGGWDPVKGEAYSDRLPAYRRMDIRLTHLFAWRGSRWVVFGEVMNALGRHNAQGYAYSADYRERKLTESYFSRRILVAGASIGW